MTAFAEAVAIVTGGASGIGRALCEELGARGAHVLAADLDADGAAATAQAVLRAGGHAEGCGLDVRSAEAVAELVKSTARRHGRIDLMVNAAGIGFWGPAEEASLDVWREVFDVGFWGVVHGTAAAYTVMAAQRAGCIVNVASLAGLVPVPGIVPYAAAKHAVVGLSTSWWAEAAASGVHVCVACPGPVRSRFHASLRLARPAGPRPGVPADAIEAADAARAILHGAAQRRRVVVFPARARRLWLLSRLWPERLARRQRESVRRRIAADGAAAPDAPLDPAAPR